jgi:hypothetical protein
MFYTVGIPHSGNACPAMPAPITTLNTSVQKRQNAAIKPFTDLIERLSMLGKEGHWGLGIFKLSCLFLGCRAD